MKILITGAAGNLGTFICRHLLASLHQLRLMVHRRWPAFEFYGAPNGEAVRYVLSFLLDRIGRITRKTTFDQQPRQADK